MKKQLKKVWHWFTQHEDEVVIEESLIVDPRIERDRYQQMLDNMWVNVEFLKLAFQIEESHNQKRVHYIDVGDLPKLTAEAYLKEIMASIQEPGRRDLFLPRRNRPTEVVTLPPDGVTVEKVLETAQKMREFVANQ